MELKPCSDVGRFDEFVAASPYGHIHQTFEWGEIKSKFGWQPLRLAAMDDGRIVAAISLLKTTRFGVPIMYASRGPVLDYGDSGTLARIVPQLSEIARREKALFLRISPAVEHMDEGVAGVLEANAFVRAARPLQHTVTTRLTLAGRSADDLMKSFDKSTRYSIRGTAKNGLEVRKGAGDEDVEAFYALLQKTAERRKIGHFPLEFYKTVFRVLAPRGMGTLYLAYVEGRPAAGIFVMSFAGKAWSMWAGFDYELRKYNPNYALHWAAIVESLNSGLKVYDFQGIPDNPGPDSPMRGLYRFKLGFGGETLRWLGEWDVPGRFRPLYETANWLKLV